MNNIERYYNKFNEDKRLESRHGQVEFAITKKYILDYLKTGDSLLDIGAGTGKYSIFFHSNGFAVNALELVKKNLSVLKENAPEITAIQGNALNLKKFKDNTFDVTLLLGPMYHLFSESDKVQALKEAKRVTKPNGYIFVAYLLADYALIKYGIMENNLKKSINEQKIDENYNILNKEEDLYSYIRLKDIDNYNQKADLKRVKIFSPDGPTDYIRPFINKLSKEEFDYYIDYQLANAERADLLGASSHVVDILQKN